jgi:hypothetical protein
VNARWLRSLYITPLLITAYKHRGEFAAKIDGPVKTLTSGEVETLTPDLGAAEWKPAASMLTRIRRAIEEDVAANNALIILGEPGVCWLERQAPESCAPWGRTGDNKLLRFVLPLETNPQVSLELPPERYHMEAGSLWWFNHRAWHSTVNFGQFATVRMIAEFKLEDRHE